LRKNVGAFSVSSMMSSTAFAPGFACASFTSGCEGLFVKGSFRFFFHLTQLPFFDATLVLVLLTTITLTPI
jgi:hypothetical protein